jgi:PTH1 family peptidyl-tRNA hydrolase
LIAGLGNPGEEYSLTRHNIGFMVIAELAEKYSVNSSFKFDGLNGDFFFGGEKVLIFQPMKYMNRSGGPLLKIVNYYNLEPADLLIVHDDLDLKLGQLRFKKDGGSGGHNGIKSIINSLGTKEFKRLKIGVGRPPENVPVPDFVLSKFHGKEKKLAFETSQKAVAAIDTFLKDGIIKAMNKFN